MTMPARKFSSGNYRYGFNGKENDKDITNGAQDYGMRVYDSRLGKFLSVDPLSKEYPYYSPYHFAGNSPIKYLDLDGGEPLDYMDKWIYNTMVGHATNEKSKSLTGRYDPKDKLHLVTVKSVYDNVTKQTWYIHEENGQHYYWKFNEGVRGNDLRYQRGHENGSWVKFETQEQKEAKYGGQIADAIGLTVFGGALLTSGGFAASSLSGTAVGTTTSQGSKWVFKNLLTDGGKLWRTNVASGVGDFLFQTAKNGGDISENNYMSTASNFGLGPLTAGFVGAVSDLNFAGGTVNFQVKSLNKTVLLNTAAGTVGNLGGSFLGRGLGGKLAGVPGLPGAGTVAGRAAYETFGNGVSNAIPEATDQLQQKPTDEK
jgi:RHS repeat-associated protein